MGTMTHTVRPGVFSHLADVSFERIEIEYQTGRLDFAHAHSRERGNIISDFEIGGSVFDAHGWCISIAAQAVAYGARFIDQIREETTGSDGRLEPAREGRIPPTLGERNRIDTTRPKR
jgi:hypothetical protein